MEGTAVSTKQPRNVRQRKRFTETNVATLAIKTKPYRCWDTRQEGPR